jgi:tetratricopeptide (TPR) repeat protein
VAQFPRKGDLDRAIAEYTEAIRLDTKYGPVHYNRSLVKKAKGDSAGAETDLVKARELDPDVDK